LHLYKPSGDNQEVPPANGSPADSPPEEVKREKREITSYKLGIFVDQYWTSSIANPTFYTKIATLSLYNDVNVIYQNAGFTNFSVVYLGTRENPYNTTTSPMLTYFSNNMTGYDSSYTNLQWLVGQNVGGLGYVGSTCSLSAAKFRTSVAGLAKGNRLWTVKIIAHELGHNRGSPHDFTSQCAAGQSASCQCSLMSYCWPTSTTAGGAVNSFSATSINSMRTAGCY